MSETAELTLPEKIPQTDAEYQIAIHAMFQEMQRANERMDRNQVEIDRLKAETRAMLVDLSRRLAS